MGFLYKIEDRGKDISQHAVITGYEGTVRDLVVPETIDGCPVTEIGSFAFASRDDIVRVVLPRGLQTIRSFAFQRCFSLREITVCNGIREYYDGVIRSCDALKMIHVRCIYENNFRIVWEMLRDVDRMLRFHLYFEQEGGTEQAALTFPEYVNEALEDTMARAIHFSIEGAGIAYRESVLREQIRFDDYDSHFHKLTDYDFPAAVWIASDRLACPYRLADAPEHQYEEFLREHDTKALQQLVNEGGEAAIRAMLSRELAGPEAVRAAAAQASAMGKAALCSLLMQHTQGERSKGAGGRLSLDIL